MNIIIITGASSGMGYEISKQIDSLYNDKLDEIWLISRSINKLDKLSNELKHQTRIYPTDLTNDLDIETITNSLTILKPNILLLVNAAGYGIIGDFISSDIKEQAGMIRLNCEALTIMTSIALPYMKKGARILQFSSSAAFIPQPGFNVYSATKKDATPTSSINVERRITHVLFDTFLILHSPVFFLGTRCGKINIRIKM